MAVSSMTIAAERATWHNLDIAAGVILLISLAFHRISCNDA